VVERRGACMVLVRKLEVKKPLPRSRTRWEYNVKIVYTMVPQLLMPY
jgi:hypothetical protein